MKTGIFGGSFDPVHKEHVKLTEAAIKTIGLDRVFVLPAFVPPHKKNHILASDSDRLAMLNIAFAHIKEAIVCDYEIQKEGVSYSYLTVRHFKEKYPDDELYFLVGTDMLRDFPTWKNPEDILRNATLAVCDRAEQDKDWIAKEKATFRAKFQKDFCLIDYSAQAVSSTKARVFSAAGDDVSYLCGDLVAEYISKNKLYEIENAHNALANEKPERREHSIRVALAAAKKALSLGVSEKKAVTAALFHDCAKNLTMDSPLLQGFSLPKGISTPVPPPVLHQFTGAYAAEYAFGVKDAEVLDAIRYHTSGRAEMGLLEQLIFLADMVEDGRVYEGVEHLRKLYYEETDGLDFTMYVALQETLRHLERKNSEIYPLTKEAYEYFAKKLEM